MRILTVLAVMTLLSPDAIANHARQAAGDSVLQEVIATCDGAQVSQGAGGLEAPPIFPIGLFPGIQATPLGSLPATAMPPGIEAELGFGRLTISAHTESEVRVAAGPLLFVVEAGVLEASVNGESTFWDSGASLLVERGQVYLVANPGPEPASIMVAGIEPPEGFISSYGDQSVWIPLGQEPETIQRERLAEARLENLRQEETLVFLGCLRWTDMSAELQSGRGFPGPVALLVLDGQIEITTTSADRLAPGRCTVVPRYTPFQAAAIEEPAVVLMVGLLPISALSVAATPEAVAEDTVMTGSIVDCAGWQPGEVVP